MLLFEPTIDTLRSTIIRNREVKEEILPVGMGLAFLSEFTRLLTNTSSVAYVLMHGGESFRKAVSCLSPENIVGIQDCIPFSPRLNQLTFDLVQAGLVQRPDIPHYLFCDTAFFTQLPVVAAVYALPQQFTTNGIRRYGGDGLCHQHVWERIDALHGGIRRVLSIHLCDYPNLAAIDDGHPIETSIGFTSLEGLPSATGCGDIDPSIVLLLCSAGMSPADVRSLLTEQSGWEALVGKRITFETLLTSGDVAAQTAQLLLHRTLLKAIGSGFASLGSVDALVFSAENITAVFPFIQAICTDLACIGVHISSALADGMAEYKDLTAAASSIKVIALEYSRSSSLIDMLSCYNKKKPPMW